jgi:hypothetical protein
MRTFSLPGGSVPAKAVHLGTWDTADLGGLWRRNTLECSEWWGDHTDAVLRHRCYRASFYVLDCAFAVAWAYDANASGRVYLNGDGTKALLPPRALILAELPPPRLLGWGNAISVHTLAFASSEDLAWESDRGNTGWENDWSHIARWPGWGSKGF